MTSRPTGWWRPSPFGGLWFGQTVSSVGSQVSLVAIPLVAVFMLHAGPAQLAVLAALETAPYVVLALPAGLIADRGDRRRLLIACDLGRALAMGTLVVALFQGIASIELLAVVASIVGGLSAVFTVSQQAYLPEVLPVSRLIVGNQRLEISDSAARIAGPGIAGSIVQSAGAAVAVGLDAVSYLVSAAAIAWPRRAPRSTPTVGPRSTGASIAQGVRYVLADPVLRSLLIATSVFNLATGMMLAQLVLFATASLGVTAAAYGLMLGLGNVGFLVGAIATGRLERRFGAGRVLAGAGMLGAVALGSIAASGLVVGFPLLIVGRFIGALAAPLFNVTLVTVRQSRSPLALQARVAATFRAIDWGTAPIGALASGVIGTQLGVGAVMLVAGLIGVASVPFAARRLVRALSIEDSSAVDPAAEASSAPVAPALAGVAT